MNFIIFIWIFILYFKTARGFMLLKVNGINEDQLLTHIYSYNVLRDADIRNADGIILNNVVVRGSAKRRNIDMKDFKNKIFIKRLIPHGFNSPKYEYDEKFHSLYKPLVRIHKNIKNNKYDVVFIVDNSEDLDNILKLIRKEFKNTDNDLHDEKPLVENFSGNEIEDVLLNFIRANKDNKARDSAEIKVLAFGPMGILKAKQLRLKPKKRKKYVYRNINEPTDLRQQLSLPIDRNLKNIYNTDEKFIEKLLGIAIEEKIKPKPYNRDAIIIDNLTNHRSDSNDEVDHEFEYLYRTDAKDTKNRDMIEENKHSSNWFGSVGHMYGKQKKHQKIRNRKPLSEIFGSINKFADKRKEMLTKPKNLKPRQWHVGRSFKSNEELDPLSPQTPYIYFEEGKTTEKPKSWLPQYSFWNYWTYDKTIHQDECKGDLVRLGEVCIALPPH